MNHGDFITIIIIIIIIIILLSMFLPPVSIKCELHFSDVCILFEITIPPL